MIIRCPNCNTPDIVDFEMTWCSHCGYDFALDVDDDDFDTDAYYDEDDEEYVDE